MLIAALVPRLRDLVGLSLIDRPTEVVLRMQTDASATAISAVLMQRINGEKVIGYASKRLTLAQTRWSVIERERYAIIFGLEKLEQYIYRKEVKVESDHRPLSYLRTLADKSSWVARWALLVLKHNVKTSYLSGKNNILADRLSRLETF